MRRTHFFLPALILVATTLVSANAYAGWFNKELVPTLTGKRPLRVKPYVSVKHAGKMLLKLSQNSVHVSIGGVTVKTHQLQKRLQQAGCVMKTGGNVFACAPDIVYREVQNLVAERRAQAQQRPQPTTASPSAPPVEPMGWDRSWMPRIVVQCRMADGAFIGVSAGGYLHTTTPKGLSMPVGFVRRSHNPHVRFVLNNGRGFEFPVSQAGRVLQVTPWGQVMGVVGICR